MKQNCGGDKKMASKKLIFVFAISALAFACSPKSEFVESPVGATSDCSISPTSFTVVGAGEGKGRITATVSNGGKPINNASVTVTLGGVGSFTNSDTGIVLREFEPGGPLLKEFRTQANAQGRVQVDLVCPESGNTATGTFACIATFDFGTTRCSATFTTTRT